MEWFKHYTQSHEDPDISDAWDTLGDSALVFWVILEVYGNEFSHLDSDGYLKLTVRYFERKLRRKWSKIEKILSFYQERSRIFFKRADQEVSIKIPKFIEVSSNWTKRQRRRPTEAPTEVPTEAPTAKEAEAEAEAEAYKEEQKQSREKLAPSPKKPKDEKPYSPTPKEDIQRMGDEVAHAEIDAAKVALFTSGIFPEVQRFMKIAAGKNPRAVLHTLTQCYQQKPKNPGGYCRTVLEKENANFNESDALRLKKSAAPSKDEAKNILKMIRGGGQTESEP